MSPLLRLGARTPNQLFVRLEVDWLVILAGRACSQQRALAAAHEALGGQQSRRGDGDAWPVGMPAIV